MRVTLSGHVVVYEELTFQTLAESMYEATDLPRSQLRIALIVPKPSRIADPSILLCLKIGEPTSSHPKRVPRQKETPIRLIVDLSEVLRPQGSHANNITQLEFPLVGV